MAVTFDLSVDRYGRVSLSFRPIPLTKWLVHAAYPGDLAIPALQLAAVAPAGEVISSERVFILSAGTPRIDGVDFLECSAQAEPLRVTFPPIAGPDSQRLLSYRMVGMRGGPGGAFCVADEGTVSIGGPHMPRDFGAIHGAIEIKADGSRPLADWLAACDRLASRIQDVFSLGQGRFIRRSVRELYLNETLAQLDFFGPQSSTEPYQPVFHHLNRQPTLDLAVQRYTPVLQTDCGLGVAIEWLLMHPNYTEGKYLTAFSALEHLLAVNGRDIPRTHIDDGAFRRALLPRLEHALDEAAVELPGEDLAVVRRKLATLNFRPVTDRLQALLEHHRVPTADIADRVKRALQVRNVLIHRGKYDGPEPLYQHLTVLREVVVRFILTMLGFQGSYESYLRNPTWGSFPPIAHPFGSAEVT